MAAAPGIWADEGKRANGTGSVRPVSPMVPVVPSSFSARQPFTRETAGGIEWTRPPALGIPEIQRYLDQ